MRHMQCNHKYSIYPSPMFLLLAIFVVSRHMYDIISSFILVCYLRLALDAISKEISVRSFYLSQKKDRRGAVKTNEGGLEKQFIYFIWPYTDV